MTDLHEPDAETRVMPAWATEQTAMRKIVPGAAGLADVPTERLDVDEPTQVMGPYEMDTTPLLRLPVTDEHPAVYVPHTAVDVDAEPTASEVLDEILVEHAPPVAVAGQKRGRRRPRHRAQVPTWAAVAFGAGAGWLANLTTVLVILWAVTR
jgi:hypothetical protein